MDIEKTTLLGGMTNVKHHFTSFKCSGNYNDTKKTLEALNDQRRERWIQLVKK